MSNQDRVRFLNGYKLIYLPSHNKSMKSDNWNGFIYEHIAIAEEILGRELREGEEVHHLDFNRSNNHPSNLLVLEASQHAKLHGWLAINGITKENVRQARYCPNCKAVLNSNQEVYCSNNCRGIDTRKVAIRPSKEELLDNISKLGYVGTGRLYGVSDNAIRKWLRAM